ncbi:MAG: HAD family phosphatase [Bacteroidales bacterium]|nr:HAD family phosphatase [Bacteroidales bacterium]
MIRNIIFDFGGVLVDWNPHYLFDPYFGDSDKTSWFLENICTMEWNTKVDCGWPMAEATEALVAQHPEWEKEIRMYFGQWRKMMGKAIPGMTEYVAELKRRSYPVYGLTNWSAETLYTIFDNYEVLGMLDGKIVSGEERLVKPDPRIFRVLLERFGIKAQESVFIDDNPANVEGARSVGLHGIRFTGVDNLRKELEALLSF